MEHEIRTSLENVTAKLRAAIDAELDGLAAELMRGVETARERASAELDAAVAERVAQARLEFETEAAVREANARADAARAFEQRESQIRASAIADARQSVEQEFAAAHAAREAHEREGAGAGRAQVGEQDGRLEAVERLLASVRRLDAASSLRETLEVLVQSASLETPRVAVLLIEGSNVRTFAQRGFSDIPDTGPLAAGGIVDAAVRHGQPASTGDPAALKAPGFAAIGSDHSGFAAPLRVGNRTVAVLYADDAGDGAQAAPAAWPEALELLARHASMHLENLTATRANVHAPEVPHVPSVPSVPSVPRVAEEPVDVAGDDAARRYAKLLVSEIKLYNEATVRLGREHRDLRTRLRDEIEHAEHTYLARIPETVSARREYFEQELLQTLAGGDAAALGPASAT